MLSLERLMVTIIATFFSVRNKNNARGTMKTSQNLIDATIPTFDIIDK